MNKFEKNPFDRTALKDYKLLAGRSNEFRQIRFVLRNASNNLNRIKSIIISGDRGVGKTSFLNLIELECPSYNLIPVRINLTKANSSNSNELFWYIFIQIINKLFSYGLFGGKGGIIDNAIQKILYTDGVLDIANHVFRTPILRKNYFINKNYTFEFDQLVLDLSVIRENIISATENNFNEKTKILLLIDESQNIYSNEAILEEIRYIIQNENLGIGFVFAGDNSFTSSRWESVFGGTHREFEVINLTYFKDIDCVIDYFRKSLESIGWNDDEIEEKLFYRFKHTCRQIFRLTAGKPAWINTIASKMFERCMNNEVQLLKFDRQVQYEIKDLLEGGGQLEKVKLDYIESLPIRYQKWLSEIFACELSSLNQVYFYSKFVLLGELLLTKEEFDFFCNELLAKKIIILLNKRNDPENDNNIDIMDTPFYAFGFNSDAMKQWLHLRFDGAYRFELSSPKHRFFSFINKSLVLDEKNALCIASEITDNDDPIKASLIIDKINSKSLDINNLPLVVVNYIYKLCKYLQRSSEKYVLYGILHDSQSNTRHSWNIFNYDDNNKIIGFNNSKKTIDKFIAAIQSYNDDKNQYSMTISIDKVNRPDFAYLQTTIIKSKDSKKIGILLEDKMDELINSYIKESKNQSSLDAALFFYNLFKDGHDLKLNELNNSSYVLLSNNMLPQAFEMLSEAMRKIKSERIDYYDVSTILLVYYNMAFYYIYQQDYEKTKPFFEKVINYNIDEQDSNNNASVLNILERDTDNNIKLIEIKEGNANFPEIKIKQFAEVCMNVINGD